MRLNCVGRGAIKMYHSLQWSCIHLVLTWTHFIRATLSCQLRSVVLLKVNFIKLSNCSSFYPIPIFFLFWDFFSRGTYEWDVRMRRRTKESSNIASLNNLNCCYCTIFDIDRNTFHYSDSVTGHSKILKTTFNQIILFV